MYNSFKHCCNKLYPHPHIKPAAIIFKPIIKYNRQRYKKPDNYKKKNEPYCATEF